MSRLISFVLAYSSCEALEKSENYKMKQSCQQKDRVLACITAQFRKKMKSTVTYTQPITRLAREWYVFVHFSFKFAVRPLNLHD